LSDHLFVYGTLMLASSADYGRDARARLQLEARLVGAATMRGRLYDLGRYPGLVESAGEDDVVHGEMLVLADPARTLAWLDRYEGILAGEPTAACEYVRCARPAVCAGTDVPVMAWVYVYQWDVSHGVAVADGRWRPG
jgi:gamma-glutamylcyclotransferase (GGCT)/AIG2-like uncharacterized protein YtfP